MLEHPKCVLARCDECGDYFGEHAEGVEYFENVRDALTEITRPDVAGDQTWVVLDGDRLRCDACETARLCRTAGHLWKPWQRCLHRELGKPTVACGQSRRFCKRCNALETPHKFEIAGGAR